MYREEGNQEKNVESRHGASGERTVDECADIKDPVRKGLCRICQHR